ncbi:MAG: hypothetical protein VKK62_09235 [Synechococcaceae cyanobacterium]|nr:hypothetical protein [Synechococcaceae cyanobacterium]
MSSASAPPPALISLLPAAHRPLLQELQRHGFRLHLAPPPQRGAYGQFVPSSRSLWVAPIAFDLGIGPQTFLHEAVHAVQSCPHGVLAPVGWRLPLQPVVRQQIGGILTNSYHHGNRAVEQEAFAMQGQPQAIPMLISALRSRCRLPAPRR